MEQTPIKLPVNLQSSNEIKHNVACYRCIFIYHNIVHNKTNSVGTKKNLSKAADSDTVSTYQVSSVQLVTDKKLEAFNKAQLRPPHLRDLY